MDIDRDPNCPAYVTIDNCQSISFHFATNDETSRQVIIGRNSTIDFKPVDKKRIRDLRPGDRVVVKGREEIIESVELYR